MGCVDKIDTLPPTRAQDKTHLTKVKCTSCLQRPAAVYRVHKRCLLNFALWSLTSSNITDLDQLYKQSLSCLDYSFIEEHRVIHTPNPHGLPESLNMDIDKIIFNSLEFIKRNDISQAAKLINDYITSLSNVRKPDFIKYKLFTFVSAFMKGINNLSNSSHISDSEIFNLIFTCQNIVEIENFLANILLSVAKDYQEKCSSRQSDIIEKAKKYILSNIDKDISLSDIAQAVYLTPSYLTNIFKQETGMSAINYVTEQRMILAKKMLTDSDMKIKEIALKLGYNTPQSFLRFFKKHYHITPEEFRKQNRTSQ